MSTAQPFLPKPSVKLTPTSQSNERIILGIDPGLRTTGFGVIASNGIDLRYIASGTISTKHLPSGNLPPRLQVIFRGIEEIIDRYKPTEAAIEIVFMNINPQASLLLGQARGTCIAALVHRDLPLNEFTALQMKKAIAGHGKAAKAQVQEMVKRLLKLPQLPGPDAADALGLAITQAHAALSIAKLMQPSGDARRATGMFVRGRAR
jgi:crossover junction endodeoxyribonuclease RuvC